jgi:hypothetical protein
MALLRDDAMRPITDIGDAGVPFAVFLFERALAPKCGTRHLGFAKLESLVRADGNEVWCARDAVPDRLNVGL